MSNRSYKETNFIIAEILACISFVLNTICVVMAKNISGPFAPAWLPDFGVVYWAKTILTIIGLIYFFTSRVFTTNEVPRYVSISTLIILWYSIPVINSIFTMPLDMLFSLASVVRNQGTTFESRIPTQIIWSVPMFIVVVDLLKKLKNRIIIKNV